MRRFKFALVGLFALLASGTLGFHLVEGKNLLTSAYFTVITLTTVGFGDVVPSTPVGRAISVVMILGGVSLFAVLISSLTEAIVEGQIQNALGRKKIVKGIASLRNHFIVCGFGRIGSIVARQLRKDGVDFVIIEHDPETVREATEDGYLCVQGDATDDDVLENAGILRARGLVAVLPTDADNVYLTMSAREVVRDDNRRLLVVARGEDERTSRKLHRAGADRIVSPYEIGGLRMAHAILRPNVIEFIEAATRTRSEITMEEVTVHEESRYAGQTLAESGIRQEFGLIIVAVRRPNGRMAFNPSHKTRIEAKDVLITMGPEKDQKRLVDSCA